MQIAKYIDGSLAVVLLFQAVMDKISAVIAAEIRTIKMMCLPEIITEAPIYSSMLVQKK